MAQEARTVSGIKPTIDGLLKSIGVSLLDSRGPRFRVLGEPCVALVPPCCEAFGGQGIGKSPGDKNRDSSLLPVGQSAFVCGDFFPRSEELDGEFGHGRKEEKTEKRNGVADAGKSARAPGRKRRQRSSVGLGGPALLPAWGRTAAATAPVLSREQTRSHNLGCIVPAQGSSYTSTSASPLVLPAPETWAV